MQRTFQDCLQKAKGKTKNTTPSSVQRKFLQENYHQYELLNTQLSYQLFFDAIEKLSESPSFSAHFQKGPIRKPILRMLETPQRFYHSLLSFCQRIHSAFKEEERLSICHYHYDSHLVFLALYLRYLEPQQRIIVVCQKQSRKNWQKILFDRKCTDPETELGLLLESENIQLQYFEQACFNQPPKGSYILIDLFHTEVVEFKPLLLQWGRQMNEEKAILYFNNALQEQVTATIQLLGKQVNYFPVELNASFPLEIEYQPEEEAIKRQLLDFLREDNAHPQKQDIVIFYRNQHLAHSTVLRFTAKLRQILQTDPQVLESVQFISSANNILVRGKNHIFLPQNAWQLIEWNYDYSNVFEVVDFGFDLRFLKDSSSYCYIQKLSKADLKEKSLRLGFVGVQRVGKYIYTQRELAQTAHPLQKVQQVMSYCLRMVELGFSEFIQAKKIVRIANAMEVLEKNKIIRKKQNSYQIECPRIIELIKKGVDPLQAQLILDCLAKESNTQNKELTQLLMMAFVAMNTQGDLRKSRDSLDSKSVIKPSGIWRQSGYLHSCLQVLTKVQILEQRKQKSRSLSRRKTSKSPQEEQAMFGGLFLELVPPSKIEFEDMEMEDFMRQYLINQTVLLTMREQLDELRETFEVTSKPIKLENSHITQVVEYLGAWSPSNVAVFSGSRRKGYSMEGIQETFPNKQSLLHQLNESPQFLLVMRFWEKQGKKQILMGNHLSYETYISIFGSLPVKKSESLGDNQIQFHGISSAVFRGLYRNNDFELKRFEEQFKCFVEPNEELSTITISCSKEEADKMKKAFEELLLRIKDKYVNYHKIIHYAGQTNISMFNGGQITEVIKGSYVNQCLLLNLDLSVTVEDLQELFEEFFVLKNIELLPQEPGKFSKAALIQFNSQKDYYRFHSYYHECPYLNRRMEVKPLPQKGPKPLQSEMYLDIKWFVWKSHHKAIIVYTTEDSAERAFNNLKETGTPKVDGREVFVSLDKNRLILDKLGTQIDQVFLERSFSIYGSIEDVQILKKPQKEPLNQETHLENLIRSILNIQGNQNLIEKCTMHPIQKHKNGLRACKVEFKRLQDLKQVQVGIHEEKKKIGEGRSYAEPYFTKPVLLTYPSALHLYEQVLQSVKSKVKDIQATFKEEGGMFYLVFKAKKQQSLNVASSLFEKEFTPTKVNLSDYQKGIILTEIGIENLIDLEQKYNCKLLADPIQKTLKVICKGENYKNIFTEINARVEKKLFYRIRVNSNTYKNLEKDSQKLIEIKNKYHLTLLELEKFSKTLIFEGSAVNIHNALNYLMHIFESYTVPEEELINTDVCLICYEEPLQPYRLQNCGHKFCFTCVRDCVNSTLGDISMFPIKCPHCLFQMTVDDLESIIEKSAWNKLINMAANQFVTKNSQLMTFCYNPGCNQINFMELTNFKCDLCNNAYCCECKQKWHPGLTCKEAKEGGDHLFKEYMKQNGVRQCPNPKCKMPIIRTDGCYRVTCSRCNKSMCFKCEPNKMIAYDNYNDCYKHLNDVHGGYW